MDRVRVTGNGLSRRKTATGSTWVDLLLVLVSGTAMWAAFPPVNQWWLVFPSMALLVALVDRIHPWRGAGYAGLWAMAFFIPHISWMETATDGTTISWIALAGAEAFFIALWGLSFSALGTWNWARTIWGEVLGGALLWVTFEEVRSRVPLGGFAWGKLAYSQVNGPLVGLAPLGGEILTSFAVVAIAILVRRSLGFGRLGAGEDGIVARLVSLATAVVLFLAPAAVPLANSPEVGEIKVALIQGNVEIPMAETFAIPRKVTGNHIDQTRQILEDGHSVDLIFWGENGADLDPRVDPQTADLIGDVSRESGVPILFGLLEYQDDLRYNWMGVWDPREGLLEEMYGKQHPVPWGEYVPMRAISEFLATATAQISVDMASVDNPAYLEVELGDGRNVPMAIGICFEVAYEPLIAEGVAMGGELIVIPTNNAQFQNTAESEQQLQMAQFRAAEFSRATVQVSTNGVSGVIRPDGSLVQVTGTQEAAYLVDTLPLRDSKTPFTYVAAFLPQLVMGLGLTLAATSLGAYVYARGRRKL
ncbi:apolipoprotein N-acyltransferase [Actinomyces minihominis]|uniref:apolipoprotein N-acyltransferase n=1 Tax=Actinomyces minihominis TaxID=2002838 RepID=UPI000C0764E2|nr:apolipoprotein N-acyltransferase [Actinomyces minihominis]